VKKVKKEEDMNSRPVFNKKGVTLIELLVGLVISGVIIAGIYRMFIGQSRAYTIQEQVVEVQQNIRGAMELILRDVRMAGYTSNINPATLATSIFPGDASLTVRSDAIRVEYQRSGASNTVVYYRDANSQLIRELYINSALNSTETVLQNLAPPPNGLQFTYGVDGIAGLETSQDGAMDDQNGDGIIDDNDCLVPAATVSAGNLNITTIRISITAEPSNPNNNPDIANIVPRNLVSTVNLRNLCLVKSN
jgi:prepilin-type N-terminal cleavage/methylation domain-containing protein